MAAAHLAGWSAPAQAGLAMPPQVGPDSGVGVGRQPGSGPVGSAGPCSVPLGTNLAAERLRQFVATGLPLPGLAAPPAAPAAPAANSRSDLIDVLEAHYAGRVGSSARRASSAPPALAPLTRSNPFTLLRPGFHHLWKAKDLISTFTTSILEADVERENDRLDPARQPHPKRRRRRAAARRHGSDSEGSASSSGVSANGLNTVDDHVFRVAARDKPGLIFYRVAADTRLALGQKYLEQDVSQHGGIFKRWFDGYFSPTAKLTPSHQEEFDLLVPLLDHLLAGRTIEAADILASRVQYLTVGINTGEWAKAREMLAHRKKTHSLVDDSWMAAAAREAKKTAKRNADFGSAGSSGRAR